LVDRAGVVIDSDNTSFRDDESHIR
jgi:hypothetical protein